MQEVLKFLADNPTFYLATDEDGQPRVRPFGFVMEYEGRLAFCTNNQKDVFKQMQKNPKVELCVANAAGEWLRLCGSIVSVTSAESQKRALEIMPGLGSMYAVGDGKFEIFALDGAEATFASMKGDKRVVKL